MRLMAALFVLAFLLSMAWVFDNPGGKAFWIAFVTWALLAAAVGVEVFVHGRSRLLGALSTAADKPVLPKDIDGEIDALKTEREGRKATHDQIKADALAAVLDKPIKPKDAERFTRALKTTIGNHASTRAALNRLVTVVKPGSSPDDAIQEIRALKAAQGQLNALVTVVKPGATPDDVVQQVCALKADVQALTAERDKLSSASAIIDRALTALGIKDPDHIDQEIAGVKSERSDLRRIHDGVKAALGGAYSGDAVAAIDALKNDRHTTRERVRELESALKYETDRMQALWDREMDGFALALGIKREDVRAETIAALKTERDAFRQYRNQWIEFANAAGLGNQAPVMIEALKSERRRAKGIEAELVNYPKATDKAIREYWTPERSFFAFVLTAAPHEFQARAIPKADGSVKFYMLLILRNESPFPIAYRNISITWTALSFSGEHDIDDRATLAPHEVRRVAIEIKGKTKQPFAKGSVSQIDVYFDGKATIDRGNVEDKSRVDMFPTSVPIPVLWHAYDD